MSSSNGDACAYPLTEWGHSNGLTKRELFAAMAMQGLLSEGDTGSADWVARESVKLADALLAELEVPSNE